ncbi:hypothetical protein C7293_28065 [filamentous cyanobacterium CCT1]|nr:hypothetical protein C7293_28065 [filamentous cyanobacterium CCT1]PSN75778.1 hypothetical protein C8B47_30790 [filamentous cyanobacterium CCP4]
MADLNLNYQSTDAIAPESESAASSEATPGTTADPSPTADPAQEANSAPMTSAQAEQILAELKTIKQNLLWILLLGGFFAARAFFFHY